MKKTIISCFAIFSLCALLSAAIWGLTFDKIDALFFDFHATLFKRTHPGKNLKLVSLKAKDVGADKPPVFSLDIHSKLIEQAFASGAKAVIYAIDLRTLAPNKRDYPSLASFVSFVKQFENLYFVIPSLMAADRIPIYNDPLFSQLKILGNPDGLDMMSGATDWVTRRIMVDPKAASFPYDKILGLVPTLKTGIFMRNGFPCIKMLFSKKNAYEDYVINEGEKPKVVQNIPAAFFKNNYIFVGYDSKFDLFNYRKVPYHHELTAMKYPEVLANVFDNLLQKDYPKIPPLKINFLWMGLTRWELDTTHTILITFFAQYISLPIIFIRAIRQNDKKLQLAKQENLRTVEKAKITAKSAKTDLGFRIATQVAHDIRSPVMALQTVRMLGASQLPPEIQRLLETSINKINDIADTLLKKFRTGAFETINEAISVDIHALVQQLVETYNQTHPKVKFEVQGFNKSLLIPIEKTEIERAFTNIINNGIEAMGFSGKIKISLTESKEYIEIYIQDNGKGISPEIQNNIFKTGFTHGKATGTGLGLSQAKEAFQKNSGDIQLVSSKAGETIFKLILKKSQTPLLKIKTAPCIVIVEDVTETLTIWKTILQQHKIEFLAFQSFKEYREALESKAGKLFGTKQYTLITDLIFDTEIETGLEVIQFAQEHYKEFLFNWYLCTSLSSNQDILKVCADLNIAVFGKKDLDKIQIQVL
jgi:signal transduction histidine kinase